MVFDDFNQKSFHHRKLRTSIVSLLLLALALSHAGCFLNESSSAFTAELWFRATRSLTGVMAAYRRPLDPAFAAAPPDTDLVGHF